MQFEGAVIREQGVTFGIVVVKPSVLHSQQLKTEMQQFGTRAWGSMPIVLMAQDAGGTPSYYGRSDLVRFLAELDMSQIPWKDWSLN